MSDYCCPMCEMDRHPIPTEIDRRPDVWASVMGGALIGGGLWVGVAAAHLLGELIASTIGWWPLLWIMMGIPAAAGLWSETSGRRR